MTRSGGIWFSLICVFNLHCAAMHLRPYLSLCEMTMTFTLCLNEKCLLVVVVVVGSLYSIHVSKHQCGLLYRVTLCVVPPHE